MASARRRGAGARASRRRRAGEQARGTHEVAQAAQVVVGQRKDNAELYDGVGGGVLLQVPQRLARRHGRGQRGDGQRGQATRHDQARACANEGREVRKWMGESM